MDQYIENQNIPGISGEPLNWQSGVLGEKPGRGASPSTRQTDPQRTVIRFRQKGPQGRGPCSLGNPGCEKSSPKEPSVVQHRRGCTRSFQSPGCLICHPYALQRGPKSLLQIFATFQGCIQMLPPPGSLPWFFPGVQESHTLPFFPLSSLCPSVGACFPISVSPLHRGWADAHQGFRTRS